MISVNDFKTGLTISVDNGIWKVIDFQHVKPGKGSAFVRSKLRNLRTGAIQETFRWEKVEQAMIENRRMQYLYAMEIIMYSWIMRRLIKLNYRLFKR